VRIEWRLIHMSCWQGWDHTALDSKITGPASIAGRDALDTFSLTVVGAP